MDMQHEVVAQYKVTVNDMAQRDPEELMLFHLGNATLLLDVISSN